MTYSHKSIELEYYIQEGISPVHYDLSDLNKHFQIRASLDRLLGVIPSLGNPSNTRFDYNPQIINHNLIIYFL